MRDIRLHSPVRAALGAVWLAALSAVLACQAAARVLPTAVPPPPSSTPSPAPTSTRRPTLTPTPRPDISDITLGLPDLPKGFKARQFRDLDEAELKRLGMTVEDFFLFENEQSRQYISGYRTLLADLPARQDADFEIADQEGVADSLADWVGATDLVEQNLLYGFDTIGDTRMAVSFVFLSHERQLRVDGVVFRRGSIYFLITIEYSEGYKPLIKVKDLAAMIDGRIQENPEVSH
jgi:hypothetical protein